ncbi:hypothetical protein INT43_000666 [Umbelopsis isabellina]|uniref:DH domain-containing protein n=1 Tax=Mortierella isabellina TaxID=91625 RepID=A0A8H7Q3R2_MORIS|nr:hypothetical protein INT43_000666 [Umbelopsis isabellina]
MATTTIVSETGLSRHQLPTTKVHYYNSTSDSSALKKPAITSAEFDYSGSSSSVVSITNPYSTREPLSHNMSCNLVESQWLESKHKNSNAITPSASVSKFTYLPSGPETERVRRDMSIPQSLSDSSLSARTNAEGSEHAQWARDCIARLLSENKSLEFAPNIMQKDKKTLDTNQIRRSTSENMLIPENKRSNGNMLRQPSRRIDRARSFKQPGVGTISEENTGSSQKDNTQLKPQEPSRIIRRLSFLAQPLKRSLSLISDRGGSMESINTAQENERRALPKKDRKMDALQQTPRSARPMSMAVPSTSTSLLEQPPKRNLAHRMSSIELMQYLSSNLLNVEQDLHHDRLEHFRSTNSSNVTTLDDNTSSTTSDAESPDTVLSGIEFPIAAFPETKGDRHSKTEARPRKRSLRKSISNIDLLALGKVFKSNTLTEEQIMRSSSYGGKSNTKTVSKREMRSIITWKNTVQQLKSEEAVQLLPPLSYQETMLCLTLCVWQLFMCIQSEAQRIRNEQIRRFIIQEIYTTEQTYLDHLNIIKTMFMDPFIAAATQTTRPLINPQDISTIFAYIPNIIEISNILAYRLESVVRTWHEQQSVIGAIFLQMESDFEVYIRYAVNFHQSQRCINRAHNNILYRRFIQESLRKKETNRMGLTDYMIIPIQRVTRYSLLLKDLKKHTPTTHPDYNNIDKALKVMTGLALAMNDAQKKI